MNNTISLVMIVKNEARHLSSCLDLAGAEVDEIVVVDTGSTDKTREIAGRYTDKVYSFPWDGDFSAARNFALDKAAGDWILSLDADEELIGPPGVLREVVKGDAPMEAYLLPLHNVTAGDTGEFNLFQILRLFRNNGRYRFSGRIHEQVTVPDRKVVGLATMPQIRHKMLPVPERRRKSGRNLALLSKALDAEPENPFLRYYLGVEWLILGKPGHALPLFEQAYKELPRENLLFISANLRYLVTCLKSLGREDEALCLCLENAPRYPEYTDLYYLGGLLFEEKEEYTLAIKWLEEAIRCGPPPPLFSHMNGSGSFLASSHLGSCHEKMGQDALARKYYEQALASNPRYIYPVYGLFYILLKHLGPLGASRYFEEKGYWSKEGFHDSDAVVPAVADLFFTLGFPRLARQCLRNREYPDDFDLLFRLGKYTLFTGELQESLCYLGRIPRDSMNYAQAQVLKIVAQLALGQYSEAKMESLELWKQQESRCMAALMLYLWHRLSGSHNPRCPKVIYLKAIRGESVLDLAMELLENIPVIPQLTQGLAEIIKGASPQGSQLLREHYRKKAEWVKGLAECRFGAGVMDGYGPE